MLALLSIGFPSTGPERFRDFMHSVQVLSVQVVAHVDGVPFPGKGTLVMQRPGSFRFTARWSNYDYTYVKSELGAVEYTRFQGTYQTYDPEPAWGMVPSLYTRLQGDSIPTALLNGDLTSLLPPRTALKLTSTSYGVETYQAAWNLGSDGKMIVGIDSKGRLLSFDYLLKSMEGTIHRRFALSDYDTHPKIAPGAFGLEPPVGLTIYRMPYTIRGISVGEPIKFGTWQTASGPKSLDPQARGRLVLVRESASPPADRMVAYFRTHKPPRNLIVLSLGPSGGDYWSPSATVANALRAVGTPLLFLIDRQGVITHMWMGFDPDQADKLWRETQEAVKG